MDLLCFNGKLLPCNQPLFTAANRGFRYGDGVFETIKMVDGRVPLALLHWDRLFTSLKLLNIKPGFNAETLTAALFDLCRANGFETARVRLAVYRDGESCSFVLETFPLDPLVNRWHEEGYRIGVYPYARKAQDSFSNLKSANYLPYVLAEQYAKEEGWDEALVLNNQNFFADASKANLFVVKKGALFTPALHQGCINGVMRRCLIEGAKRRSIEVHQTEVGEQELLEADEIFLTNALYGIRPVRELKGKTYDQTFARNLYATVVSTIWD